MNRVQHTGDIIGLTGLYTTDDVRAINPWSAEKKKEMSSNAVLKPFADLVHILIICDNAVEHNVSSELMIK